MCSLFDIEKKILKNEKYGSKMMVFPLHILSHCTVYIEIRSRCLKFFTNKFRNVWITRKLKVAHHKFLKAPPVSPKDLPAGAEGVLAFALLSLAEE